MPKTLEEKFKSFCNSKNLEINQNQITTIKTLDDFYNKNFHSSIFKFFKKEYPKITLNNPEMTTFQNMYKFKSTSLSSQ